jgi:tetratricopeptide (TPR) repeat protein
LSPHASILAPLAAKRTKNRRFFDLDRVIFVSAAPLSCATLFVFLPDQEFALRLPEIQRGLLLLALSAFLSACGSNPYSLPKVETAEPSYEEPPATVPPPVPPQANEPQRDPGTGAHSSLVTKAAEARSRGDYNQALAYLERAQRIDPDNAEIYLALAQTHDAAGNGSQARATAERGLLYCNGSRQCDALRTYTD